MLSVPVALLQMDVIFGNPERNLKKIRNFASDIKEENTLLIVPELCLTGYSKEGIEASAFTDQNTKFIDILRDVCFEYNLQLYGSIAEMEQGNYYNTAVFIDSSGLIASYRKTHLFGPMGEKELFKPGDRIVSMSYNEISYGLSICYDLRFPSMYQTLAKKGVQVMLISAEWPNTRITHWSSLLKARAIENQVYVIGVNRVGTDGNYNYGGYSAIYSPFGDELMSIPNENEKLEVFQLDLGLINDFRNKFDVRADRVESID